MRRLRLSCVDSVASLCLVSLLLVLSVTACDPADDGSTDHGNSTDWELVWADEFNAAEGTSVDLEKWTFDLGKGQNGWGNNELQHYTDRTENVSHDGEGNLVITAKRESFAGSQYTSARIKTEGLFSQRYGRFEARLKTPFGQGLWPAFWMLGTNINEIGWPRCGEIDIMELRGHLPSVIAGSVHGPGYSAGQAISSTYNLTNSRFDANFHVFAVEWSENKIDFFVDDNLYQSLDPSDLTGDWVFDAEFFLILNVAVGGNYPGNPTASTPFDQTMTVDYVRVYQ